MQTFYARAVDSDGRVVTSRVVKTENAIEAARELGRYLSVGSKYRIEVFQFVAARNIDVAQQTERIVRWADADQRPRLSR